MKLKYYTMLTCIKCGEPVSRMDAAVVCHKIAVYKAIYKYWIIGPVIGRKLDGYINDWTGPYHASCLPKMVVLGEILNDQKDM